MTGLPDEAVRAVESLVSVFRDRATSSLANLPYEEWSKAFGAWAESHRPISNAADWSRQSIYAGRGE